MLTLVCLFGQFTPGTMGCWLLPKTSEYGQFPPAGNGWRTLHPILGSNPTSLGCRDGATNLRRINVKNAPRHHFSTLRIVWADRISPLVSLAHFLLATWDRDPGLRLDIPGSSLLWISTTRFKTPVALVLSAWYERT
jgi:hypothetical protein